MKDLITINETNLRIRPSAIDTFNQCSFQWAKVFLEGITTIPNSRAAIGTGVHAGVETMWNDAIRSGKKDPYVDGMVDAGVEAFDEELKLGNMRFDDGEDQNSCHMEIVQGINCYVDNLVDFLDIPTAVEKRFTVPISNHPLVQDISGTVDYIAPGRIDDVKTSKRKPSVANYKTQQSIYRFLAEENGHPVTHNMIQGVVFTKTPQAMILEADIDVQQAKNVVNSLLDTLRVAAEGSVPLDVLFRCNPKYYLCSNKYCTLYGSCPATKRHSPK